ncbi:MAG: hypothetical protein ACLFV8_04975 [Alphaproteobacteria bacterium]
MTRFEKAAVAAFTVISLGYVISSAYLGINGDHLWRQADVYGHILGFTGFKNFEPFDLFFSGKRAVFDLPLYQFVIAKLALIYDADPLVVTRFVNASLWAITAYAGYRLAVSMGSSVSGVVFLFSLSVSPLILHYFSTPLPDLLVIALSLAAIALLEIRGTGRRPIMYAFPLLAIATLIKSPVPFIFLVFYAICRLSADGVSLRRFPAYIRNNLPAVVLLGILAVLAVLAEQLRILLLGEGSFGFAQSPGWYFGPLALRFHPEFWHLVWTRVHEWGPFAFGYIGTGTIAASLVLCNDRQNRILAASALGALLCGWLVFSNVYLYHNYYQIPLAIMVLLSFSKALSLLIEKYAATIRRTRKINIENLVLGLLVVFASQYTMLSEGLGDRSRTGALSGIEYALRDRAVILYVADKYTGPGIGGELSTKFRRVSHREFELNCDAYLSRYSSVLSHGYSICLDQNRTQADYYVRDEDIHFFRAGSRQWAERAR